MRFSAGDAVHLWYAEVSLHDFDSYQFDEKTGEKFMNFVGNRDRGNRATGLPLDLLLVGT